MDFALISTLSIFVIVLLLFSFEVIDKVIAVMAGVVLLFVFGIVGVNEVMNFIDIETLLLLFGMMLLVEVMQESGVFGWLNLKLTQWTAGNPFLILSFFLGITFLLSAFLSNVTTIIIVLPITIALTQAMGIDPKLYIITEIIFSNIGGTLTLIGDPPNILIGTALHFSFMDFIYNLSIPVFTITLAIFGIIVVRYWKFFRPIYDNIPKLFVSSLLVKKVQRQFALQYFNKSFAIKSVIVLLVTLFFFIFPEYLHLSPGGVALAAAVLLMLIVHKSIHLDHVLQRIEWNTLLFFCGLFVLVGALEKVGVLEMMSDLIVQNAHSYVALCIIVLWVSGILSAFIDNIPFVAIMIPVLQQVMGDGSISIVGKEDMIWWALSLGACLGGNGTLVGASSNLVAVSLAKKHGIEISFLSFMKYGSLLTIMALIICTIYILFSLNI